MYLWMKRVILRQKAPYNHYSRRQCELYTQRDCKECSRGFCGCIVAEQLPEPW